VEETQVQSKKFKHFQSGWGQGSTEGKKMRLGQTGTKEGPLIPSTGSLSRREGKGS